jgi:hypothetical protein
MKSPCPGCCELHADPPAGHQGRRADGTSGLVAASQRCGGSLSVMTRGRAGGNRSTGSHRHREAKQEAGAGAPAARPSPAVAAPAWAWSSWRGLAVAGAPWGGHRVVGVGFGGVGGHGRPTLARMTPTPASLRGVRSGCSAGRCGHPRAVPGSRVRWRAIGLPLSSRSSGRCQWLTTHADRIGRRGPSSGRSHGRRGRVFASDGLRSSDAATIGV